MFDRITRILIEASGEPDPPRRRLTWSGLGTVIALIASIGSLAVQGMSYRSNSERISIIVRRNLAAPINQVAFKGGDTRTSRTDHSYETAWDVYLVNTSEQSTTAVTGFFFTLRDFDNYYSTLMSDRPNLGEPGSVSFDGKPFTTPVVVAPGQLLHLRLLAKINVSRVAFPTEAPGSIPAAGPGFFTLLGSALTGMDGFANRGDPEVDQLVVAHDVRHVHEPCVSIVVQTGRGNEFYGSAAWYVHLWRRRKSDPSAGDALEHDNCPYLSP